MKLSKLYLQLFCAGLTCFMFSCNSQEPLESHPDDSSQNIVSGFITESEAIKFALNAKNHYSDINSRSLYSVSNVRKIQDRVTRSESDSPLLYIVEFDNDEGCAVICGKRCDDPVLAVTECGNLSFADSYDNPGAQFFMEQAIAYSQGLEIQPIDTLRVDYEYAEERLDTLFSLSVPKRLNLAWHQWDPLNQYCPVISGTRAPTGCGPLATAMVFAYFNHPMTMDLTFSGYEGEHLNLNWKGIKNVLPDTPYSYNLGSLEQYEKMAAKMIREIGERAHVQYGKAGTATSSMRDLIQVMTPFGYGYRTNSQVPTLSNERKSIIMAARSNNTVYGRGHVFIIDGQEILSTRLTETVYQVRGKLMTKLYERVINETYINNVHVNWGWGGKNNGYYKSSLLSTSGMQSLDGQENDKGEGNGEDTNIDVDGDVYLFYEIELVEP